MSVEVPHFALPFRFATPRAAVTEQDSIDEIGDCVLAVMVCPQGFRVELPSFGMPDPVFAQQPLDIDAMRTAIELWEPRASIALAQTPDLLDELIARVSTRVQVRTQE